MHNIGAVTAVMADALLKDTRLHLPQNTRTYRNSHFTLALAYRRSQNVLFHLLVFCKFDLTRGTVLTTYQTIYNQLNQLLNASKQT